MGRREIVMGIAVLTVVALPGAALAGHLGGAGGKQHAVDRVDRVDAYAAMNDTEGNAVGKVTYTQLDEGVYVKANLWGLDVSPDFRGFHIHEQGICESDAPDGPFTTAGGHWAPEGNDHGEHAGDLPSLLFTAEGSATAAFVTDRFTIDELIDGEVAQLLHAGRDNFANIPDRYQSADQEEPGPDELTLATGDAGARIACGVVTAVK